MFLDGIAFVVLHVAELLGKISRGEEFDAVFVEFAIDNNSDELIVYYYLFSVVQYVTFL